jgi:hypothetical protein
MGYHVMQNNDSKPNTLAGHNVQVGDVVRGKSWHNHLIVNVYDGRWYSNAGYEISGEDHYKVMARAKGWLGVEEQFGDWEIWNGKGEQPTGRVQVQHFDETRVRAKVQSITNAGHWDWSQIIAFRRVVEPVLEDRSDVTKKAK